MNRQNLSSKLAVHVSGSLTNPRAWFRWRNWYWWVAGAALAVHIGTFVLRLPVFWPTPKLLDFGAFFGSAWALRLGGLTYVWSPSLSDYLVAQGINSTIPYSFPIWPWLLQPMTWLSFPLAAWVWLVVNLAILGWCSLKLAHLAAMSGRRNQLVVFALALTFGPVALTLTLGQTSILMLALVLWIGRQLRQSHQLLVDGVGALLWVIALASKLFPLSWLGGLFLIGAWRTLARGIGAVLLFVALHALLLPSQTYAYLTEFLLAKAGDLTRSPGINDQSLVAVIWRMTQPSHTDAPGITLVERDPVSWASSWSINPQLVLPIAVILLLSAGLGVAWFLWQHRRYADAEGQFYLWVMFSLTVFPHTERYDHTVLLAALAWLWGRQSQWIAVIAYFLVALSRLTYLWARILPAPWGPLLSSSALWATIVLGIGIVLHLRSERLANL